MNVLTTFAQPLTMSSREIAELTGKRHDHVLRDIDNLLAELGETSPQLWGHLPDAYGRPQRVAFLPKDLTLTLVAGYSAPLRHRIVSRWLELEEAAKGPALPNFSNPAEASRAWALEFERAEEQARLVVEHAKKVEALPSHDLEVDDVPILARSHLVPIYVP
ncbi:Rha family transcriptional regulator [Ideonella sp. B7]|uniref:Rha family transcriptional regulator n=1 Tax=Ideonella benzenivorans TaxID=2831643 RepID=UPI001CEE073D|nr:Rha family transcriptional regulator [Ideonella benzenivorans]MCA6217772.1 Rha family transcriptional regulator [Ideonella benzenivorans]